MFKLMTLCVAFATVASGYAFAGPQNPQENMELLMRGPLHEAFAEVPQDEPLPNPIVPDQPPAAINELPPEYKPSGENVQWIPGYWAWDDERNDFIWISGIWRDFPPGQRWVPGFWEPAEGGFRWVSGFWIDSKQSQIEYYPPPPASLDVGPNTPAPSNDHFYAPGHWAYQGDEYLWQPGCWMPRAPELVWVPPAYIWTPYGCVFRPGYWDRLFDCRGMVFAPVGYYRPIYVDVNYVYTPSCVINTSFDLLPHLFIRRHCRSYYFGDWYDDRYWGNDFCAWSQIGSRRGFGGGYDPFYSYYSHVGLQINQVNLMFWIRSQNDDCRQHAAHRPPRTFAAQREFEQRRGQIGGVGAPVGAAPLGETLDKRVRRNQDSAAARGQLQRLDEQSRRNLQREQQAAERAAVESRRQADRDSRAAKLAADQAVRRQETAQKIESAKQTQQARDAARSQGRQPQVTHRAAEQQQRNQTAAERQAEIQSRLQQARATRDQTRHQQDAERAAEQQQRQEKSAQQQAQVQSQLQQDAARRDAERTARQQQSQAQNQARELENAQRRAASEEKIRVAEQQRSAERDLRRQTVRPQLQPQQAENQRRQAEQQQRRANDQASLQAAAQQRAAEQNLRRQQESQERSARLQQQNQQVAQERAARDAQNQQREAQRQAQQESMRQRQQAEQQQRHVERQQRDSERQQRNQDRGGKGGKR